MWIPPQHSHPPCSLNINSIVICAQVILGYGRVWSVHQMYTSFPWETEGAFDVAFKLRQQHFVVPRWGNRPWNAVFWVRTLNWNSLRRDAMMQSHFKYALNIGTAFVVLVWCNRILIPVLEVRALRFGTQLGPVPNGTLNPRGPLSLHFRDVMPLWLSGRSLLRSSP